MGTEKTIFALSLALTAGFVDAVGYITLHTLFVAHMSGNSARLGVFLGHFNLTSALPLAAAVLLFVFGIAFATALAEFATRRGLRSVTGLLLVLQAALIAVFMAYGSTVLTSSGSVYDHGAFGFYTLAAVAIVAIGLQVCALQRVGGTQTRTTYVSGMLTKCSQETVNWMFWLRDGKRGRQRPEPSYLADVVEGGSRRQAASHALLFGGIWCLYLGGAVAGSYVDSLWRLWSLGCPLAILAVAIAADWHRPIHER